VVGVGTGLLVAAVVSSVSTLAFSHVMAFVVAPVVLLTALFVGRRRIRRAVRVLSVWVGAGPRLTLRSEPSRQLGASDGRKLLIKRGFFDYEMTPGGHGIPHKYTRTAENGEEVIYDEITSVYWQASGSSQALTYANAHTYLGELRSRAFGGFDDWRLPTLDEAMSLMERKLQPNDRYVASVFSAVQAAIWTADSTTSDGVWVVSFEFGYSEIEPQTPWYRFFTRAVR
jgi:uncharacterized protein DUF1566